VLQPVARRAGLGRVTWHQFRHIHSSLLNDLRMPVQLAQSVGKVLFGLVVIDLMSGRAASVSRSARRNLLLLLRGANIVAIFLEARTIAVDPQGQRLGDRLAHSQVVEVFGARELLKSFQDWLMGLDGGLGQRGRPTPRSGTNRSGGLTGDRLTPNGADAPPDTDDSRLIGPSGLTRQTGGLDVEFEHEARRDRSCSLEA
jgi:hypothetical protein